MNTAIPRRSERWWLRWHPLAREIDHRIPADWVTKRATVSHRHRYCYFRIPKCANSTVMRTLAQYDGDLAGLTDPDGPVEAIKRYSGTLFRARAWSTASLVRRYRCFTVVRNPFSRLLSAYLDKIAAAEPGQYGYVAMTVGRRDITEVTFDDFVRFLEGGGLHANAHWAPQCRMLPVSPSSLAFVGHQEELERDLARLVEVLGLGPFQGLWSRKDRRRHAAGQLETFYTDELVARVHSLYALDFDTFGYTRELPMAGGGD